MLLFILTLAAFHFLFIFIKLPHSSDKHRRAMKAVTARRLKSRPSNLKVDVPSKDDADAHPATNGSAPAPATAPSAEQKPKRPLMSPSTKRFSRFRSFHRPRSTSFQELRSESQDQQPVDDAALPNGTEKDPASASPQAFPAKPGLFDTPLTAPAFPNGTLEDPFITHDAQHQRQETPPPLPFTPDTPDSTTYLHPLESRLATARKALLRAGLWPLVSGSEPRPPITYKGRWDEDEALARRHSAWIGRDAQGRHLISTSLQGDDDSGSPLDTEDTDARGAWARAEAACATAVRSVGAELLRAVGDYASAAQIATDLQALGERVSRLGLERETLMVLWAYHAMHALDRAIFQRSLLLVHPRAWSLEMLRRQEVVWDSVFDELFDLESDWRYEVEEEDIVITISDGGSGGEEERYRVGLDVLLREFEILVVEGYEGWMGGHPTHFQKCDERCAIKTAAGSSINSKKKKKVRLKEDREGDVHFRSVDDGDADNEKDAAVKLQAEFAEEAVDMDRFRPPGKRRKEEG